MTDKTPLALFAYNRPLHTQRTLDALFQCSRKDECSYYFFIDGPRAEEDRAEVDATHSVLKKYAEDFDAKIIQRSQNYGLAKSIVSGVTELCERYGQVIVLEDDLVVAPDFLSYMLKSLDYYQDIEQVMQVGGFTIRAPDTLLTDVFLLPVTTTWGWATWQRAWQSFSWEPEAFDEAELDCEWVRLFDLNGTCNFSGMLNDRLAGRNDSWGILWWYAVSRQKGLVSYPKDSLVWNGGFDGSGVHCGTSDFVGQKVPTSLANVTFPLSPSFPPEIGYEILHLTQLEDFFRLQSNSKLSHKVTEGFYWKAMGWAKHTIGKIRNALH